MKNTKLPPGWKWMSVESLCVEGAPVRYGILQPGPDVPGGVLYLRPTEIDDDQIHFGTLRRTTPAIANQYRRSSLRPNDIVLSIVGTIGKVAVVPEWLDGGNITQSSARIRPDTSKVLVNYLAYCLRSPLLLEQFGNFEMGTAVRRLNIAHVRALQIPIPPLS
jgi:type I restriction enzyme S subunit